MHPKKGILILDRIENMNRNSEGTRRLVIISMLITMASVLHVIEGLIPAIPITGARLGLANIITLTAIVCFGYGNALAVAVGRTVLGSIFGPGLVSVGFAMSFSGSLLSWAIMSLAHKYAKNVFSHVGLSLLGAVFHNIAQLAVASLIFDEIAIVSMFPILMIFALPTGIMVGLVSHYLINALTKIPYFALRG